MRKPYFLLQKKGSIYRECVRFRRSRLLLHLCHLLWALSFHLFFIACPKICAHIFIYLVKCIILSVQLNEILQVCSLNERHPNQDIEHLCHPRRPSCAPSQIDQIVLSDLSHISPGLLHLFTYLSVLCRFLNLQPQCKQSMDRGGAYGMRCSSSFPLCPMLWAKPKVWCRWPAVEKTTSLV